MSTQRWTAIRQDLLETALEWIADRDGGDILDYMSAHQHDEDCTDLFEHTSVLGQDG